MAIALGIIFWLIIGLLIILAALLFLPVKLRLLAQSAPHPNVRLEVQVFGGLAPAFAMADREKKRAKQAAKKKPKARKKKSGGFSQARVMRLIRAAPDLIVGLLRQFHFEHLNIDGVFGLGNPAATGQLYGQLTPLIYGTYGAQKINVTLRPDFENIQLAGTADALISVTPATLIPPAILFAWRSFGPR